MQATFGGQKPEPATPLLSDEQLAEYAGPGTNKKIGREVLNKTGFMPAKTWERLTTDPASIEKLLDIVSEQPALTIFTPHLLAHDAVKEPFQQHLMERCKVLWPGCEQLARLATRDPRYEILRQKAINCIGTTMLSKYQKKLAKNPTAAREAEPTKSLKRLRIEEDSAEQSIANEDDVANAEIPAHEKGVNEGNVQNNQSTTRVAVSGIANLGFILHGMMEQDEVERHIVRFASLLPYLPGQEYKKDISSSALFSKALFDAFLECVNASYDNEERSRYMCIWTAEMKPVTYSLWHRMMRDCLDGKMSPGAVTLYCGTLPEAQMMLQREAGGAPSPAKRARM